MEHSWLNWYQKIYFVDGSVTVLPRTIRARAMKVLVLLQYSRISHRCICKECYFVKDILFCLLATTENEEKDETSKTETNAGIVTFIKVRWNGQTTHDYCDKYGNATLMQENHMCIKTG